MKIAVILFLMMFSLSASEVYANCKNIEIVKKEVAFNTLRVYVRNKTDTDVLVTWQAHLSPDPQWRTSKEHFAERTMIVKGKSMESERIIRGQSGVLDVKLLKCE